MRGVRIAEPIRLKFSEKGRHVEVQPEDNDRFVLTVQDAIAACRLHIKNERIRDVMEGAFRALLSALGEWVAEHESKIASAFLTRRNGACLFLIVMNGSKYDAQFMDEGAELDWQIARNQLFAEFNVSVPLDVALSSTAVSESPSASVSFASTPEAATVNVVPASTE